MLTRSLVVLSLTAALLAGCGGDDEPTAGTSVVPPAATTPAVEDATPAQDEAKTTKTDPKKAKLAWVAAVNKRCKAYAADTTKILRDFSESGNTSPAAAQKAMASVPIFDCSIEGLLMTGSLSDSISLCCGAVRSNHDAGIEPGRGGACRARPYSANSAGVPGPASGRSSIAIMQSMAPASRAAAAPNT